MVKFKIQLVRVLLVDILMLMEINIIMMKNNLNVIKKLFNNKLLKFNVQKVNMIQIFHKFKQ